MSGGGKVTAEDVRAIKQYVEENPDAMQEEVAYHCHRSATTVRNVLKGRYDHLLGPDLGEGGQLEAFPDTDRIEEEADVLDDAWKYFASCVSMLTMCADSLGFLMRDARKVAENSRQALDAMKASTREVRRCIGR